MEVTPLSIPCNFVKWTYFLCKCSGVMAFFTGVCLSASLSFLTSYSAFSEYQLLARLGATWTGGLSHAVGCVWSCRTLLPRAKGNAVRVNAGHQAGKPKVVWEQF